MRKRRTYVTVVAIIMALLMVLSLLFSVASSFGASAATLNEIQSQISQSKSQISQLEENQAYLTEKKAELQEAINALASDKATYESQKAVLDEKIDVTRQEIENINAQIEIYRQLIAEKETQLKEAVAEEEYQLERYRERVRVMEEGGSLTYMEVLFTAKNFSDLLTKISDIQEIIEYDNQVSEKLETARIAVEDAKTDLEETKSVLDAEITVLQTYEAELDQEITAAQAQINTLQVNLAQREDEYESAAAAEEAAAAEIAELAKGLQDLTAAEKQEIARLQEEASKTNSGSSGGAGGAGGGSSGSSGVIATGVFIWPSVSNLVTSGFGGRQSPGGVGSTNHQGIDIGAGYGTSVFAAAGGVVVTAGWNGGYGNYILVNHGNGYATAYAHMSQLNVSKGATVYQGQVIGLCGSTGRSTGNHVHFEVYVGGSRTNPLNFFSSSSYRWS